MVPRGCQAASYVAVRDVKTFQRKLEVKGFGFVFLKQLVLLGTGGHFDEILACYCRLVQPRQPTGMV